MAGSNITLSEEPDFILGKSTNDRVKNTAVMEQNKVTLLPILGVNVLWRDTWSLDLMDHLPDSLEIIDDGAISEVQFADCRRMDLDGELASDWILPCHRQDLDLLLLDWWQLVERDLKSIGDDTQSIRARLGTAHPDIWMWRIFDLGGADEFLVLGAEDIVHRVSRDECRGSEWHIELLASSIIVAADLAAAGWDLDGEESGDDWWCETVERSIDVPAVEAREIEVLGLWDDGLVESLVVWVLEFDVLEAFVGRYQAVADNLDLRLMWDCLQVWVKDRALGVKSLSMSIAGSLRIEALGQFELCLR